MHVAALPAEHVISYRGVPLTSVPRTVIDLARMLPFGEGVAVADSALHARLTSKAELTAVIAGCPRWRGLQRARQVTGFSDARSESVLESLSRAVFYQAGLPPPDLQVWIGDDGEVIGRVDFLWRRYNTIGEADGALKYQTPARARTQLERDARLRAAGTRSSTSPGRTSPGHQPRSWTRSRWRSGAPAVPGGHDGQRLRVGGPRVQVEVRPFRGVRVR